MFAIMNTKNILPKISVIMPVCLQYYEGCASNRIEKYTRAIRSFLAQNYENKELIIVCDGDTTAIDGVYRNFLKDGIGTLIKPYIILKQPKFSGRVREHGLKKATGDIICYLDYDDMFGAGHLSNIASQFNLNKYDWVYYNDFLHKNEKEILVKQVQLEHGSIGTSSIAHKNIRKFFGKQISWKGCNGYGHDWNFVNKLIKHFPRYTKIYGTKYYICHIPKVFDY